MTLIEASTAIGDVLTKIDTILQTPGLSDSDWQTLYALRKHLDDEQHELIGESLNEEDAAYQDATTKLKAAAAQLAAVGGDLTKVASVINTVAQIASYADQILQLAG